jgi:ketosteroid isomerase-like protein
MADQRTSDATVATDQLALDAARSLVEAYPVAVDANDVEGVVALFGEGATLETATARYEGRQAVAQFYRARLGNDSLHLVTDIRLSVSATGEVGGRSRFVALLGRPDCPEVTWGSYVDRIVVREGQAEFHVRNISVDGAGPCPEVWSDVVGGYRQEMP